MLCYKCLQEISGEVQHLFNHLKYVHQITGGKATNIICCQDGCMNTFTYTSSYKRHLISRHAAQVQNDNDDNQQEPVAANGEGRLAGNGMNEDDDDNVDNDFDDMQTDADEMNKDALLEHVALFIANMKSSSVPYSFIQKVITEVDQLVENIVSHLHNKVALVVADIKNGIIPDDETCDQFLSNLSELKNPFKGLDSQHLQDQYFKEKGLLIEPVEETVGRRYVSRTESDNSGVKQVPKKDTFQYIPIPKILKKYLEQPGIMEAILDEKESQNDDLLSTYRDGTFFKNKFNNDEIVIPILLYNDDYETGNPLGSRKTKNKISGFYMSLLCLPEKYQSTLNNILLAACAKSEIVAQYGVDCVLSVIVKDLEKLEEDGLEITCDAYTGIVKPYLFQVIGDNLGIHQVLGFAGSFSANFMCRFCKAPKELTREQVEEDESLLRNRDNFAEDVAVGNVSTTGINRYSKLNDLNHFHAVENYAPDIMHDFLEGLLPIELKLTISSLISDRYFTLQQLNNRISSFNFGPADKKNKPSPILPSALANPRGASGQTASQMKCLAQYLPLIIGDLVPEDSEVWELFLLLLQIYKIVVAPKISWAGTIFLKSLIRDHHELFLELYEEGHLIPKHHFIIHYPRLIRLLGPLVQYSSMRKEGKHKPFKRWARACNNYTNISKTVAIRHQQQQSYNFMLRKPLGSEMSIQYEIPVHVSTLDEVNEVCLALGCEADDTVLLVNSVDIHSYKYKPNCMVHIRWSESGPEFGKVERIISVDGAVYLVVYAWKTKYFDRHRQAYAVEKSEDPALIQRPQELLAHRPFHITKCNGEDTSWFITTIFDLV